MIKLLSYKLKCVVKYNLVLETLSSVSFMFFFIFSADKNSSDKSYEGMCYSLRKLATLEMTELQNWLSKMIMIPPVQVSHILTLTF